MVENEHFCTKTCKNDHKMLNFAHEIGLLSVFFGGDDVRIERTRYVVMRNNRTEIWCGLSKHFHFVKIDEIKDVAIKTYRTKRQAESGCSSWDRDFEVVECKEVIEIGE